MRIAITPSCANSQASATCAGVQFETLDAKLDLLGAIDDYGVPTNTISREDAQLAGLTNDEVRRVFRCYFDTDAMIVAVIGDAATPASRLEALGYGKPAIVPPVR